MNETCKIRAAAAADAPALLAIYAPYVEKTAITFEYDVPKESEFAARIAHTLEKYPYLVAERGGEIAGYAYAGPFKTRAAYDWAVESTVYVKQGLHRCGVGRALYTALEGALALQNICNVEAAIAEPETEDEYLTMDSIRFHTRMGYHRVGTFYQSGYKFGRWYHLTWMEKQILPHLKNQPAVLRFDQVRGLAREKLGIE